MTLVITKRKHIISLTHLEMRDFILSNIKKQIHNVESKETYLVESRLAIQAIFELAKRVGYINQEWIDSRINYSSVERLKDLYKAINI